MKWQYRDDLSESDVLICHDVGEIERFEPPEQRDIEDVFVGKLKTILKDGSKFATSDKQTAICVTGKCNFCSERYFDVATDGLGYLSEEYCKKSGIKVFKRRFPKNGEEFDLEDGQDSALFIDGESKFLSGDSWCCDPRVIYACVYLRYLNAHPVVKERYVEFFKKPVPTREEAEKWLKKRRIPIPPISLDEYSMRAAEDKDWAESVYDGGTIPPWE